MNFLSALAVAMAAVSVAAGHSIAADMASPRANPSSNWDGAYVGGHLGVGAYHTVSEPGGDSLDLMGPIVGGQVGYNFHLTNNVVLGAQLDGDWDDITNAAAGGQTIEWSSAVIAKLGLDLGPVLPYVLGGVAVSGQHYFHFVPPLDERHVHTGWTAGAGVEGMITDSLSAFVEYRYASYEQQTYTVGPFNIGGSEHSVRTGLNYHF